MSADETQAPDAQRPQRRPMGSGSIEMLASGKARVRVRVPGEGLKTLGTYPTKQEAQEVLDAHLFAMAGTGETASSSVFTLRALGRRFLEHRELRGTRGIKIDRARWAAHIDTAFFAGWPLVEITARDIRKWRDDLASKKATKAAPGGTRENPNRVATKRKLSHSARKNTLNLLRVALSYAVEEDLIASNPALGVKIERDLRTDVPWTFLRPEEQTALLSCASIPEAERLIVQFAIWTGMRRGELWSLHVADVHAEGSRPHVVVRFGSPGKPPKNGKIRRVPLFGLGLEAARAWLAQLSRYATKNTKGLMFPTRRGHCRHGRIFRAEVRDAEGKRAGATLRWPDMLRAAGIDRRVRFHDLRHTCGSSLIAGWWGRRWSLVEVRDLLGHTSVNVTERYAHLAQSALEEAAYATGPTVPRLSHGSSSAQSEDTQ